MSKKSNNKICIQEGMIKKGGLNSQPSTARPILPPKGHNTKKDEPKKKHIEKDGLLCTRCNSVICSLSRYNFKFCKCESIFVDGGDDYFRIGGPGIIAGEFKRVKIRIFEK